MAIESIFVTVQYLDGSEEIVAEETEEINCTRNYQNACIVAAERAEEKKAEFGAEYYNIV